MMTSIITGVKIIQRHVWCRSLTTSSRRLQGVPQLNSASELGKLGGLRTSILTEISDESGSLQDVLGYFSKYDISLTHIESRPCPRDSKSFHIYLDFEGSVGEMRTDNLMMELKDRCKDMLVLDAREVPWFPRHISELDLLISNTLDAGTQLQSDHPGFHDIKYRQRRQELAAISKRQRFGHPVSRIEYTDEEISTWGAVYRKQRALLDKFACKEYVEALQLLEQNCGYSAHNIPQVEDISDFLRSRTGFQLRPVSGLLSSRDFLNGLAFRTFFSTQYIRHHTRPLYTPEPDICHELLGHVPMFADPDFADLSQEIGLASLGASDEQIQKLATCYWFSVEFGLVRDSNAGRGVRAYGAGLLSSFGELEYACKDSIFMPANVRSRSSVHSSDYAPDSGVPKLLPWDPEVASVTPYPVTCYQPTYFVAESLADAKERLRDYCQRMNRPFYARYNELTNCIWVDRAIKSK